MWAGVSHGLIDKEWASMLSEVVMMLWVGENSRSAFCLQSRTMGVNNIYNLSQRGAGFQLLCHTVPRVNHAWRHITCTWSLLFVLPICLLISAFFRSWPFIVIGRYVYLSPFGWCSSLTGFRILFRKWVTVLDTAAAVWGEVTCLSSVGLESWGTWLRGSEGFTG